MPHRNPPDPGGPLRRITSTAVIIAFALVMTASVLGVMAWKALDAKKTALASGSTDIQNLAHSLSEHASHTIQAADIAMAGMVDLLKYRDPDAGTVQQISGRDGEYAAADSRDRRPRCQRQLDAIRRFRKHRATTIADRSYFRLSSRHPDNTLRISEPLQSRLDDRPTIIAVEAHHQAGRQFRRRRRRSDRQATTSTASTGHSSSVPTAASA